MSKEKVRVILNADDFGYTPDVDKGIIQSIEEGILTSTSVMVRRPAAEEARELLKYDHISIGLHLDLTEEGIQRWLGVLKILAWPKAKIEKAFNAQVEKFTEIVGRLPDHIDSHHHIHRITRFKEVTLDFSRKHRIPVRSEDARFEIGFYGRSAFSWNDSAGVRPQKLISLLQNFASGTHEIMCHPGLSPDAELKRLRCTYNEQRQVEVDALTNPNVREFIQNSPHIQLISWKDVEVG